MNQHFHCMYFLKQLRMDFFIPTEFQGLKYSKETFLEHSVFLHTAIILGNF